jgi:hypothetical protein
MAVVLGALARRMASLLCCFVWDAVVLGRDAHV